MKTVKQFEFSNGDKVKEKITGFTGIITGVSFYITGCNQYLLTPPVKDDGSSGEAQWYDEGRLEIVKSDAVQVEEVASTDNGCDIPAPNKG